MRRATAFAVTGNDINFVAQPESDELNKYK